MSALPNETPEADYTLAEAARALKVSTRWIRNRISAGKEDGGLFVEHIRRGNRILFTAAQLEALRVLDVQAAPIVAASITTGRKHKS